jgi:hypothetical protein
LAGDDLLSKCHHRDTSALDQMHRSEQEGIHHWTGEINVIT